MDLSISLLTIYSTLKSPLVAYHAKTNYAPHVHRLSIQSPSSYPSHDKNMQLAELVDETARRSLGSYTTTHIHAHSTVEHSTYHRAFCPCRKTYAVNSSSKGQAHRRIRVGPPQEKLNRVRSPAPFCQHTLALSWYSPTCPPATTSNAHQARSSLRLSLAARPRPKSARQGLLAETDEEEKNRPPRPPPTNPEAPPLPRPLGMLLPPDPRAAAPRAWRGRKRADPASAPLRLTTPYPTTTGGGHWLETPPPLLPRSTALPPLGPSFCLPWSALPALVMVGISDKRPTEEGRSPSWWPLLAPNEL